MIFDWRKGKVFISDRCRSDTNIALCAKCSAEKRLFMAKQRRTLDERIQSCTTKEEEMLEKLKQYQAQRKQDSWKSEKRKKNGKFVPIG